MDGLTYASFLWLCSVTLAHTPEAPPIVTPTLQYNPPHWQADGFPPVRLITLEENE